MNLNNFMNIVYIKFTENRYKQDGVGGDGCRGELWKKDSNKMKMRLSVMYSLEMVALEALGCQSWICWGFLWEWPAQTEQMVGNMYRRIVGILDKRYKILSCQAGGKEEDVREDSWMSWRKTWRGLVWQKRMLSTGRDGGRSGDHWTEQLKEEEMLIVTNTAALIFS